MWDLSSFSIQLRFSHWQKVAPGFRIEYPQQFKNPLKKMGEIKYENSFDGFSIKKIISQSNTGFCLPSGFNEDFIRNILWQHHHHQQENINQRQQNINQFTSLPPTPALSEASSGNAS